MIEIIVDPDDEFLEDDEMELRRYGHLSGHPANEDFLERNEEDDDYDRYR